jgi:hypothetical protein
MLKIIIAVQCVLNMIVSILGFYPCWILSKMIFTHPSAQGDVGAYIFGAFFGSLPIISMISAITSMCLINKKPDLAFLFNLIPFIQVITFFAYVIYLIVY